MDERKRYLDIMKFIGMCCLFLAHVQGPFLLEEIRGFDVVMMVFISGLLSVPSIERMTSTKTYIMKRVKRLVVPTWIFLTFFYLSMLVIGQKPLLSDIIKSFLFQRDCGLAGGVWIIWVYLICAVLAPLLYSLIRKKWLLPVAVVLLVIYDISVSLMPVLVDIRCIYYSFYTLIPYGVVLLIGMRSSIMSDKSKALLGVGTVLIHIILGIILSLNEGSYVPISEYKYPARIYYLSYGVPITFALGELLSKIEDRIPNISLIRFVSEHSLWIYLWQIMMLTVVNYVIKISQQWLLSWIFLMVGSILITWIQNVVISMLYKKTKWSIWKYFKG